MPETYTIGEFAEKYRFSDRSEVLRYIALGGYQTDAEAR